MKIKSKKPCKQRKALHNYKNHQRSKLLTCRLADFLREEFGIKRSSIDDIKGGYVAENVKTAFLILKGEKSAKRDIVILNAAAAIICGGAAGDFKEGIKMAANSIDSGAALEKLNSLIEYTRIKQ